MAEELDGGLDQPSSLGPVATALAIVLTLAALGWAADLYRSIGLLLIDEQFNAFILAVALALVYLTKRVRKGRRAQHRGTTFLPRQPEC
jgi:hypothetical protein